MISSMLLCILLCIIICIQNVDALCKCITFSLTRDFCDGVCDPYIYNDVWINNYEGQLSSNNVPSGKGSATINGITFTNMIFYKGKPYSYQIYSKFSLSDGTVVSGSYTIVIKYNRITIEVDNYSITNYPNGDSYMGPYNGILPHGSGTMTYKNGDVFNGYFWNGDIITGKIRFINGDRFLGKLKNNKIHGRDSIYTFINGSTYTGTWDEGTIIGNGILKVNSYLYSDIYNCTYENGSLKLYSYLYTDYTLLVVLITSSFTIYIIYILKKNKKHN